MSGKPWIGFAVRKAPGKATLLVQDVAEGGPADKAGLRSGDELYTIDSKRVTDSNTFKTLFKSWQVGQSLTIEVLRDDNGKDNAIQKKVTLIVGKKEREPVANAPPLRNTDDIQVILKDNDKLVKANDVIFNACDDDMSGLVTRQEFAETIGPWLESNLGKKLEKNELENIFDQHDKDKSGFMKRSEFVPVTKLCLEEFLKKHGSSSPPPPAPASTPAAHTPTPAPAAPAAHPPPAQPAQPAHTPAPAPAPAQEKVKWYKKCCPCLKKK